VALDELRRAVDEDRLALLPVEQVLGGDAKYSANDLAERTGLSLDVLEQHWQALGLARSDPDARSYGDEDLRATEQLKQFLDAGLPVEGVIEVARIFGEGMARAADASKELVGEAVMSPGATERDVAMRFADAARLMIPLVGPELEYIYRLHLREQLRTDVVTQAELASGYAAGAADVTVLFADLVDFTKLGERIPPEELGSVARRLTAMAGDVAEPPVRLVKTIGDAAMLVSREGAAPVVAAALDLIERADSEGDEFPQLRAGVAAGAALERAGDWYGRPVNVASRVTGIAYPGSVLATAEVRDAAPEEYRWSDAGRRRLKNVKEPVPLFRARPLEK
jgi:adenylate cyclase